MLSSKGQKSRGTRDRWGARFKACHLTLPLRLSASGAAGLLGGLLVLAFPPAGLVVGGEALLAAVTAGGATVGALAMGLISKDIPKKDLAAFEKDIAHGRILLMVDVPKEQVEQCKARILGTYPEAAIGVAALPPA